MNIRVITVFAILSFFSCKNQDLDANNTKQNLNTSNFELLDTVKLQSEAKTFDKKSVENGCPDIVEMDFYKKYGKAISVQDNGNRILYEYNNDLIEIRTLFENCKIRHRRIKSVNGCAISYAKFAGNKLITFDSTDNNCNKIIEYVDGTFFSENKELPKSLLKYLPKQ